MEESNLPKGWIVKKLGEICFTTSGGTPSRKVDSYYGGTIPWVKSGELDKGIIYKTEEYITEEAVQNSSAKVFPAGTLLIALYGATIGKIGFLGVDAATNQAICGIYRSEAVDLEFLSNYLFSCRNKLIEQGAGGAQPNISQTILKDLPIPLPPLAEQHRIVAKLEELFSELDKGIESLKTAQQQLKVYRQAVLKYAFEGKLTNPNVKEGELPEGWEVKTIGETCEVTGGLAFKSTEFLNSGKYQVIRIGNIRPGIIRFNESPVFLETIEPKILEKGLLKINDLVISQTGTKGKRDYGFTALIKSENLLLNQRLASIRCGNLLNHSYLLYFTMTESFKNQFFAEETGNVGHGNVGIKAIVGARIRFPNSIEEQQAIVQEIESRLSVCDKIEEGIEQGLKQAEALRQSILKKAFEGKLVAQDPTDEPASVLLERIKKDRAATQTAPKPRTKKVKP